MFQFNRFAHLHPFFKWIGFPIQKSADQFIFADPRSLSQLITSFIASESQGIPRVPFLTFFYDTAFCSVCMLFLFSCLCCCFFAFSCSYEYLQLSTHNFQQSNNLLSVVFSFNYFFQYVKERFVSLQLPVRSLQ